MLNVDLGLLHKQRRLEVEAEIPADDPGWADAGIVLKEPLTVVLEVQQAGPDAVVRGRLDSRAALTCRRCLAPVAHEIAEEVTWLFRAGISEAEAESEDVYALPARSRELDLLPAIWEQVALAVPEYVLCDPDCRGFCPHCGGNRNLVECGCTKTVVDDRWAALRRPPE
ncbi:MAG: DUF177 domain-containing protein [Gemmatimonadetes bacterium]|nr:DUF177 domain-containing protein [Gemmatimonadota bacterium]